MVIKADQREKLTQVKAPKPAQDPDEAIAALQAKRGESAVGKKTNFLVYAFSGAGKTSLIATAPRPIFIDSWDPTGLDSIRQGLDEGWIIADCQWEEPMENPAKEWMRYETTLRERLRSGFFDRFATYALDSMTLLNTSLLAWGQETAPTSDNRSAYLPAQTRLLGLLRRVVSIPCDVIVTALPYERTDEVTQRTIDIGPSLIGRVQTPCALFSELYYLEVKKALQPDPAKGIKAGDPVRSLITNNDGLIRSKSRLNNMGQIPLRVPPDIRAIKKMAGLPFEDKT